MGTPTKQMTKNLVIVESPAKAKTIEGYLGKDFLVKSSYGHVRDLTKGDDAIDIAHGFAPKYEISEDKIEVVKELRRIAKETDTVWLATDDDREGEAISWHLKEALNLDDDKVKRIVFREITKKAILKAIESPRSIDLDLVNAQQARRILDRLVGFEISPILWKKIKGGLSAGRVQSVALRLVVEREREIENFKVESYYKVTGYFLSSEGKVFPAELSTRFNNQEDALQFLNSCIGAEYTVGKIDIKPGKRSPAAPFTTSTLQQEASRKLGFSVAQTMSIAQKLYESGKISYMRTDSVSLSEEAIAAAEAAIRAGYGNEYVQVRRYKTKSESAQEAHEAIRPTDFTVKNAGEDRNEQRLYELIYNRTLASQMADAQIEKTVVDIIPSTSKLNFVATGEVIKFDGFLKVYMEDTDVEEEEDNNRILPRMTVGEKLRNEKIKAVERFTRPAPRYTEASLVKKLEEMGIGRPSTYAPTISTIQKREYVVKESREGKERPYTQLTLENGNIKSEVLKENTGAEKSKLFPTDMGMIVNDFLLTHFPSIMDFHFTATVEKEFDQIAQGEKLWEEMLQTFYTQFHKTVEDTENLERSTVSTARYLGQHPETGSKVFARLARYGPVVQIGDADAGEKPVFASLKKTQRLETITLEEALELFKLPRETGEFEGAPMLVNVGKFGPYIRHKGAFYSIPKAQDPYSITGEECIAIIEAKRKADAEKLIKAFPENEEVQVLNGRFGPYIVVGKKNVKIPKGIDPETLTLEKCLELAEATPEKKAKFSKSAPAAKAGSKTTKGGKKAK
jgi:DNA topoisomerase-1